MKAATKDIKVVVDSTKFFQPLVKIKCVRTTG
jgi:hypothetical protein